MPTDHPHPPILPAATDAELATLTPEEREAYKWHAGIGALTNGSHIANAFRDLMSLRLAARAEAWRLWSELPEEWRDGRPFWAWDRKRDEWRRMAWDYSPPPSFVVGDDDHMVLPIDLGTRFTHFRAMPLPPAPGGASPIQEPPAPGAATTDTKETRSE